jgi:hypothetical protein
MSSRKRASTTSHGPVGYPSPYNNLLKKAAKRMPGETGNSPSSLILDPRDALEQAEAALSSQAGLAQSPPAQHQGFWTCPRTGLLVPKTALANVRWRQDLYRRADKNPSLRRQLRYVCSQSVLVWMNLFGWTYRQKEVNELGDEVSVQGESAHRPFITWLVQDELIEDLNYAIDAGQDRLIDKSRDMGASWSVIAPFQWRWQFRGNNTFLEVSRKQDLVDRRGDMDSLFEKHRYMLRMQPPWMRPRNIRDHVCLMENLDNGSMISGESTNESVGQGGRKTAILLDEFARVKDGEAIDLATRDTSACRIFNSTPQGPGTWFTKLRNSGRVKVFMMHWSRHPEKSREAKQAVGPRGKVIWTNVWYEKECKKRSPQDVAMNLDIDHEQSGLTFFDATMVEQHRIANVKDPVLQLDLRWSDDFGPDAIRKAVRATDVGKIAVLWRAERLRWRLWIPLVDGRPPQQFTYVFGCDVATGSGSSNSVVTVRCAETGAVVAKFWDAFTSPEELADVISQAGIWFGGRYGPAFTVHENNGPGGIVGRKLAKSGYPHLYYQRVDGTKDEMKTGRYGWHSSPESKTVLLARLREEMHKGKFINPCKESLDEALDYIYENGKLMPGKLREEAAGGRELHGDHVIADALTVLALDELPRQRDAAVKPPVGSFAWRKGKARLASARSDRWG